MVIKHAVQVAMFLLVAGCTTQTTSVSRQSAPETALQPVAAEQAISVTRANIGQFGAQEQNVYLVGRGDVLQIHAIDAAELTAPAGYLVEADGTIQVPFLGRVSAAERTTGAIRTDIATRLRAYLPNPQVDLRVLEYNARQITVIGDVMRPNRQALTTRPLTVIDAINAAGGVASGANMRRVAILRNGREYAVDMDGFLQHGASLPVLRDGDVVQVGRSAARNLPPLTDAAGRGITLSRPGYGTQRFELDGGVVTLGQILESARIAGTEVQVLRMTRAGKQAFHFNMSDAADPQVAGRFALQAGDTILPLTAR